MVSILKNHIIKHLSVFARNLTSDQISLEVLRGNGELRNIQLNEQVLAERLELPPWLRICKAVCSRIRVEVSWTKLKTTPVKLYIDEIHVTLKLLPPDAAGGTGRQPSSSSNGGGGGIGGGGGKSYDLAERVLEGLSIYVLSVDIQFESEFFGGSLTFSQFSLESKAPNWKDEPDLHKTRIHDKKVRQILFWKQCRWVTLRVEASAHAPTATEQSPAHQHLLPQSSAALAANRRRSFNSPLRLITENGKIRIAIKKSDIDCSVIDGRIEVIFDEIFWVSTLLHLRSAIDFYKHIKDLANAANAGGDNSSSSAFDPSKNAPTTNLAKVPSNPFLRGDLGSSQPPLPLSSRKGSSSKLSSANNSSPKHLRHANAVPAGAGAPEASWSHQGVASQLFHHFNIHQSSHHLYIAKLDMNLYDDSPAENFPTDWRINAGAIQTTLHKLRIDFYPSHGVFHHHHHHHYQQQAGATVTTGGVGGGDLFSERREWIRYNAPNAFTELAKKQLKQHVTLLAGKMDPSLHEHFLLRQWPTLLSQNVVIRIEDITVQCVSEQTTKRESLLNMFQRRRDTSTQLPSSMCFVQMEFASYRWPDGVTHNVLPTSLTTMLPSDILTTTLPPDSTHLVVGPADILVDYKSIRWLVYVFENILNALEAPQSVAPADSTGGDAPSPADAGPDVRIELVMPRVVLLPTPEPNYETLGDRRLPQRFVVNLSTLHVSNFLLLEAEPTMPLALSPLLGKGVGPEVVKFVEEHSKRLLQGGGADIREHLMEKCRPLGSGGGDVNASDLHKHNEWLIAVPTLWLSCDFGGGPGSFEIVPLNDISLAGCLIQPPPSSSSSPMTLLVEARSQVGVALDHFQLLQLIQLQGKLAAMADQITTDREFFSERGSREHLQDTPLVVFAHVDALQLKLVLPVGAVPSPYELAKRDEEEDIGREIDDDENGEDSEEGGVVMSPSATSTSLDSEQQQRPYTAIDSVAATSDLSTAQQFPHTTKLPTSITNSNLITNLPMVTSGNGDQNASGANALYTADNSTTSRPTSTTLGPLGALAQGCSASLTNIAPANYRQPSPVPGVVAPAAAESVVPVEEIQPSKKQVTGQFPDFSTPSGAFYTAATPAELSGGADNLETMSVTTSTSDNYERHFHMVDMSQLGVGGGAGGMEDIFGEDSPEAEEAEDAAEMDVGRRMRKQLGERYFNKQINVFDILLRNINVFVAAGVEGKTTAVGYSSTVGVSERLRRICREIYNERGLSEKNLEENSSMGAAAELSDAQLRFELRTQPRHTEISARVRGLRLGLEDEVLSQLGPFVEDPTEEAENPPVVELRLEDCRVEVRNPRKKKYPLRIVVGEVRVEDGPPPEA